MTQDSKKVWSECLTIIKNNIPNQSYKTWFTPLIPLKNDKETITIQVPNQFFYEWIEEHYSDLILQVLFEVTGEERKIIYSIENNNGNNEWRL